MTLLLFQAKLPADMKPHLFIASDHAGVQFKLALQKLIPQATWEDLGPHSTESVDYPDYARSLCEKVGAKKGSLGVLICGSGVGMSIAANKFKNIRAALVTNPMVARLAREHNHANVLCLGARVLAAEYAAEILQAWLSAQPSQNPRHLQRIQKFSELD